MAIRPKRNRRCRFSRAPACPVSLSMGGGLGVDGGWLLDPRAGDAGCYGDLPRIARSAPPPDVDDSAPSLAEDMKAKGTAVRKIAFVTLGPLFGQEPGSLACADLADALAEAGHEVHLLLVGGDEVPGGADSEGAVRIDRRVKQIRIAGAPRLDIHASRPRMLSYAVMEWLLEHGAIYDVIHFNLIQGLGFYTLTAKNQGFLLPQTDICVAVQSPEARRREIGMNLAPSLAALEIDFMERECVRLADIAVAPSRAVARWLRQNDWALPDRFFVAPNPVVARGGADGQDRKIREIVLVFPADAGGERDLFRRALEKAASLDSAPLPITWLSGRAAREPTEGLTKNWDRARRPVQVQEAADGREAFDHIRAKQALAAISSIDARAPFLVAQCSASGVPFLLIGDNGLAETIRHEDRANLCVEPIPVVSPRGSIGRSTQV